MTEDFKRKKILHIITKGSPFGGAQKYVYELATNLPADQFESVVAVGTGDELPHRLEDISAHTGKNIRVIRLAFLQRDVSLIKEWTVLLQLIHLMQKEKPDVVHLNSSKIGGLGALAGRIARVPNIIFTAHGWAFNERRHDFDRAMIWVASWITALCSHTVITVSDREKEQGQHMPFVGHKIVRIHNGIMSPNFKSRDEARKIISEKIGHEIPIDATWIGTIAELHPNKNLSSTIDAASRLKENVIFVIIGEGEERKNLEKQIEENNLQNTVFLVGKIDHAAEMLQAFDIFTLNSTKEGLPYTLLEAGLASLPCLAARVGGIPEIIEHKVSGFLVRPQAKEIMLGLQYLINNPEAQTFGEKLKEKVESDFSLDKMLSETTKIYLHT